MFVFLLYAKLTKKHLKLRMGKGKGNFLESICLIKTRSNFNLRLEQQLFA
jgi:hypothetical protein